MFNNDIGKRCHYNYCKYQDFLPFNCQLCSGVFCSEHRTPESHECIREKIQKKAIVCPLCSQTIYYSSDQKEDNVWEQHYFNGCTQQPKELKKCHAVGCKQTLTKINSHTCKECGEEVCLKHRFSEDHNCSVKWMIEKKESPQQNNSALPEICEICGQRFPYVMQLIHHSAIHNK